MNARTAAGLEKLYDNAQEKRYITIPRHRVFRIIRMFWLLYFFFMLVPAEWFWIMFGGVAFTTAFFIIYSSVWASFSYSRAALFGSTAVFCLIVKLFSSPLRTLLLNAVYSIWKGLSLWLL